MAARILVIDDEESLRFTFSAFLAEEGHQVVTAAGLDEALELTGRESFDLVFSDIFLAGASGVDFLRRFHADHPAVPVVLVTGYPALDTATEALRLGAYDYIAKPVTQQTLLRVTRMALRFKDIQDEKRRIQAHIEAVFRGVKDAIVTVDRELRVVQFNDAATSLCEFSPLHLGREFAEKAKDCSGVCLDALRRAMEEQTDVEIPRFECRCGEGPTRIFTLNTAPLCQADGEGIGAVMVVRDETRLHQLECRLDERGRFHRLVGSSPPMQALYDLLEKLAPVPTTVLVTGESGTGKELIAEALHHMGPRKHGPLVKVNCSALSENLLESELFGHVRGAFTGAVKDTPGRFEKAQGGTIFLDEIGDISPRMQVRLLRVLQEKTIERVGDSRPIPVDVRVIAATHQDLPAKIRRGEFREDLFYRLKVVNVTLPPLRDRRSDLPLLIAHFIEAFNKKFVRQVRGVTPAVEKIFMNHPWPGNVRELEHVMEHAFILCQEAVIDVENLPPELATNGGQTSKPQAPATPDDLAEAIVEALTKAGGNKAKAARLLNISRRTLYRKLEELGMSLDPS